MKVPIWNTSDGRSIPLNEMTDSHIANARNFLERYLANRGHDPFYDPNLEDFFERPAVARAKKWIATFQQEQDRRDKAKKDQLNRIERKVDAVAEGQSLLIHALMQVLGVCDDEGEEEFEPSDALKEALNGLQNVEDVKDEGDNGVLVTLRMPPLPKFLRPLMFDLETTSFGSIDALGRTAKGKKTAATIKARRKATRTKVTKDAKRGRSQGRSVRRKAVRKTR